MRLFCNEGFMVFSGGVLDSGSAHRRFDEMVMRAQELPFAKQPVIDREAGVIIGYAGVNWFELSHDRRLGFGYRLVPEARGRGFATEASRMVLTVAEETFSGEILAMVDPRNTASQTLPGSSASPSGSGRSSTGSLTTSTACRSGRRALHQPSPNCHVRSRGHQAHGPR